MTSIVVFIFVSFFLFHFSSCRILREKDLDSDAASHFFPYGRIHFEENLMKHNNSLPKRKRKLQFETSSNIFIENLHMTRALETVHYVTDAKQMTDFFWFRDSGIRINVGLQNVQVIPQYREVNHMGDSEFELTKPINRDQKSDWLKRSFTKVVQHLCRNPIPESYRINLEIFKDRLTMAKSEICNKNKKVAGQCPAFVGVGEEFVRRSLDEPCLRLSTYPSRLSSANNSIVCHSNTELFTKIFQLQSPPIRPSYPDSKKCKTALQICHKCLNHDHCQNEDEVERSCCQVDCYSLLECKTAFSSRCNHPIIDCASGDVHRFTIQPIFHLHYNHSSSYKCHLKRVYPFELYQVWFYVTVPSSDSSSNISFETPRIHFRAKLNDKTQHFQFLTFQHGFGIGAEKDDVILEAEVDLERMVEEEGERHGKFSITSSKDFLKLFHNDVHTSKGMVNTFARDIRFTRPFAYSTSTWSGDGCDKNMSLIALVENAEDGSPASRQEVNVMIEGSKTPLEYLLKSVDDPPFIKLSVPGSWSVIRWWFSRENVSLLFKETLRISMISEDSNRFWKFFLSGRMSSCPGYLGLTINDLTEFEEVSKLDLVISCPSTFYLAIHLPNWSHKHEKTFEVILDDAHREYRIYLSSIRLEFESQRELSTSIPSSIIDTIDKDDTHLTSLLLYLAITFWIVYVVVSTAGRSNFCCRQAERCCDGSVTVRTLKKSTEEVLVEYRKAENRSRIVDYCMQNETKGLTTCHKKVMLCYVIFRVVCVFLFTFTAAFSSAYFWFSPTFVSTGPTNVNCSQNEFNFSDKERREKLEKEVELCENYVEDLMMEMKSVSRKLKEFSDDYFLKMQKLPSNNAYHQLLRGTIGHYMHDFENSLENEFVSLTSNLESISKIMRSNIVSNPLLSYLKTLIRHRLIFNGEERKKEESVMEDLLLPRFVKTFNSSWEKVQNYAENGRSETFYSIKADAWRNLPFISVKYLSTLSTSTSQFASVETFPEDENEIPKTVGEVMVAAVSQAFKASFLLPLLLSLDCSLILIRLHCLGDVMKKIKRKNDRFFVEGEHLVQHRSYSFVANPSSSEQRSPQFKSPDLPRGGDHSTQGAQTTPANRAVLLSSCETLLQKSAPRSNSSLNVTIYCWSWKFDEKREHLATLNIRSDHCSDAEIIARPSDRYKEVKKGKKGRLLVKVVLKFVFLVFSTSILVFFIVVLWLVLENALFVSFEHDQFLPNHVAPTSQDDLSIDDFQFLSSAHFRHSSVELTEIRTFNDMIRSVRENYTLEFKNMDEQVEKFSRKLEQLMLNTGKKHSFTTLFHPSECLHRLDYHHRATIICPCNYQQDVSTTRHSQGFACQWNFIKSAKQFSTEFQTKSKIYLVVCTSIVWLETIVRIIFVIVSKKIQLIATDQNLMLRLNSKFALKSDMDQTRSKENRAVNQHLNHLPIKSNHFIESKSERAGLFIIELNKSLNSTIIIADDLNTINRDANVLRFSETKV